MHARRKMKTFSEVNETELLSNLIKGNENAFQEIYYKWKAPLHHFLWKLSGSEEDAEDISQETFVALWNTREKIAPDSKISTYIFLLARQILWKQLRRQKLESDILAENYTAMDEYAFSDDVIVAKETELLTELAIGRMSKKTREVFNLHYKENMTYKEIAQKMNLSEKNVRDQVYIARKQIKELLAMVAVMFIV